MIEEEYKGDGVVVEGAQEWWGRALKMFEKAYGRSLYQWGSLEKTDELLFL